MKDGRPSRAQTDFRADLPRGRGVTDCYDQKVAAGEISPDPAQRLVAVELDHVLHGLEEEKLAAKGSALGWLFGRKKPAGNAPRGLYVWGGVGRGKTMLMDLFFELACEPRKRRQHFHAFMASTHDRVARARKAMAAGDSRDPIEIVAAELGAEVKLLCFDEFSVTDIADAMLLGRLFSRLFALGVVLVTTSNVVPDNLYRDGLNRGSFLPFLGELKARCKVIHLGSDTDYRLDKLGTHEVYLSPLGRDTAVAFDRLWERLTGAEHAAPLDLSIKGRTLHVPHVAGGHARFTFDDLCARPLGAADYRLLAERFHTIFVENVPVLVYERRNETKRFITLIDVLYDEGIKLVLSAAAEPNHLYRADHGTEAFEFDRTASRLTEMRSEVWRTNPPRRADDASVNAG
ncbi:cell division protein ZapE [Oryzibacter oryziterrae]|uniref:cell division protein ZapE n=1 Tax=Oryzibacter oryziterrae TaxID=2766474 RepID=UPI001EEF6235|nr:cell division protein ZapE [Oryzibacter oryziterrae]